MVSEKIKTCGNINITDRLNPCFSGGWSRRATFGSVCQRDCCNDIFNFVNVWRPKICTFSGVITDANLRIFGECEYVFRKNFGVYFAVMPESPVIRINKAGIVISAIAE